MGQTQGAFIVQVLDFLAREIGPAERALEAVARAHSAERGARELMPAKAELKQLQTEASA